jgi:cAMP-dependent protein kinase regulator/CRP/FNR family cyclic AMP-dependent transcriptional regulator/cGMP-dependent protein kinase 2
MDRTIANTVSLFEALPRRAHGQVARLADELEVPAGTPLTKQGEYAREFFVILDGTAEVVRDGERVATLGPGEFFGELGLLSSISRVAAVTALTPMSLLVIAPREFRTLMHAVPAAAERVQLAAAERGEPVLACP